MSLVIAVDPGLTGAIAVMKESGVAVAVHDMPTTDSGKGFVSRVVDGTLLAQLLAAYIGDRCVIARAVMERVNAMPTQGVSSMFSLGDSRGCIRGVIQALGIALTDVPPQKWKKDLGLEIPRELKGDARKQAKKDVKAKSVELARRLFPGMADKLARAKDHGRAEALLIGWWATKGGVGV